MNPSIFPRLPIFSKLIITLVVVLVGALLAACSESKSAPNRAPVEVGVVTLAAQPLTLSTELAGRTSAYLVAQIRPQVGGILQRRVFTEGATVKSGDLLYQIDPASYQAAYDSAKASVARAEADVAGIRRELGRLAPAGGR